MPVLYLNLPNAKNPQPGATGKVGKLMHNALPKPYPLFYHIRVNTYLKFNNFYSIR